MSTTIWPVRPTGMSPRLQARLAGGFYLINILTGVFAILFVRAALFVHGDAAATAANILTHEMRYRLGFVAEIVTCLTVIPLIVIFYNLFKIVNRSLALAVVCLDLVGNAIEATVLLNHFAALAFLKSGAYLKGFTPEQVQTQAYLSLELQDVGLAIALIFFGCDLLLTCYLIFKSTFFPRVIGAMLAIEGAGYLINSFTQFIAPAVQARIFPYFVATGLAEVSFCLWLLIVGVNEKNWLEQAAAAEMRA